MRERFLPRFPGYDRAASIEEFESRVDRPTEFFERFVLAHRPCVIRRGADNWPATRDWSIEYLRKLAGECVLGTGEDGVIDEPVREYSLSRLSVTPKRMTLNSFLDKYSDSKCEYLQAYGESFDGELAALRKDLGDFRFINLTDKRPRTYEDRAFLSKAGYTDWHVHYGDETLTVQVRGRKEFLILPPDFATWRVIFSAVRRGSCWRMSPEEWGPYASELNPFRVALEPGDVIYIPMHWWHAVEGLDDDLNVTVARVFRTPTRWLTDVRLPNVAFSVGLGLFMGGSTGARKGDWRPFRSAVRVATLTAFAWPWALVKNRHLDWRSSSRA